MHVFINVKILAMLRVNASTAKSVPETGHKNDSCTKAFKYANCGDCHTAYSKKCSIYKRNYEIQSISVSRNISLFEARTVYQKFMDRG